MEGIKINKDFVSDINYLLKYYIKEKGFTNFLKRFFIKLFELLIKIRRFYVFEWDLSNPPLYIEPKIKIEFSQALVNDIDQIRKLIPTKLEKSIIKRFERGDICFIAKHNNKLIYQSWLMFKNSYIPGLDRKWHLSKNEAYYGEGYVNPKFRRKKIISSMFFNIWDYLSKRKLGINKIFFLVEFRNKFLINKFKKIINSDIKEIIFYFRILGLRFYHSKKSEIL